MGSVVEGSVSPESVGGGPDLDWKPIFVAVNDERPVSVAGDTFTGEADCAGRWDATEAALSWAGTESESED